jgi:hypothetical protein
MRSILALSVAVLVGAGCGGGGDSGSPSSSPAPATAPSSEATTTTTGTTTASGPQVVFHLKGKTPASDSVRGGGGSGKFTVSGTVTDSGTFVDYRRQKGDTILIRRVLTGKNGKVTVVIHISTTEGDKGWKVTTGSGSYAGAQGKGEELGGVDAAGNIDITMNGSLTGV